MNISDFVDLEKCKNWRVTNFVTNILNVEIVTDFAMNLEPSTTSFIGACKYHLRVPLKQFDETGNKIAFLINFKYATRKFWKSQ